VGGLDTPKGKKQYWGASPSQLQSKGNILHVVDILNLFQQVAADTWPFTITAAANCFFITEK